MFKNKERVLNAIRHNDVDRLPLMYRALPEVHKKMIRRYGFQTDIEDCWMGLMDEMGFDLFSGGNGIGKFTKFKPRYKGPVHTRSTDNNLFYTFGIDSFLDPVSGSLNYLVNKDFAKIDSEDKISRYHFPETGDFEYRWTNPPVELMDRHFLGTGTLNSLFMIAMYLRGAEQLMVELMSNRRLAASYIDRIGQFILEFTERTLESNRGYLEFYALWDDLAMQQNLMIPYHTFREFFLPWYRKIFAMAKKHGLITYFHICGNANEVINDLIDIGVDILDPVQTSARNMSIDRLKEKYGDNICFHGGIDVQRLLPFGSPEDISSYIKWVADLFGNRGGIIIGPSHDITVDTPLENIEAIYNIYNC
jgi:uroporphyrinogen decarboxylase